MPPKKGNPRSRLSHLDEHGHALMVDVSGKKETRREASATATVKMKPAVLQMLLQNRVPKGDALATARIAGILAAKQTPSLIPLCHPLTISSVQIDFVPDERNSTIQIVSKVNSTGKTGVEMEALTAVSVAALTMYDMCKAVDKGITISDIFLLRKSGGKSGTYKHPSLAGRIPQTAV